MKIANLKRRIVIQNQTTEVDEIGNHINEWANYWECWAGVEDVFGGGQSGAESTAAGFTAEHEVKIFTVRWCAELDAVTSTNYRILWQDASYDIIFIDKMFDGRKLLKFRCKKQEK